MKLTPRQELFISEYLIDGNGARAARSAGYSEKTARQIATENLSKPYIQVVIAEKQQETAVKLELRKEQFAKLYTELERRAHSGSDRVTEQTERTQKEIDDLQAIPTATHREQLRYREDFRGVLPGLRTLSTQIRDEVVSQFTGRAESLLSTNVAHCPLTSCLNGKDGRHVLTIRLHEREASSRQETHSLHPSASVSWRTSLPCRGKRQRCPS